MSRMGIITSSRTPTRRSLQHGLAGQRVRLVTVNNTVNAKLFVKSNGAVDLTKPSVVFICVVVNFVLFFIVQTVKRLLLSGLRCGSFDSFTSSLLKP